MWAHFCCITLCTDPKFDFLLVVRKKVGSKAAKKEKKKKRKWAKTQQRIISAHGIAHFYKRIKEKRYFA